MRTLLRAPVRVVHWAVVRPFTRFDPHATLVERAAGAAAYVLFVAGVAANTMIFFVKAGNCNLLKWGLAAMVAYLMSSTLRNLEAVDRHHRAVARHRHEVELLRGELNDLRL